MLPPQHSHYRSDRRAAHPAPTTHDRHLQDCNTCVAQAGRVATPRRAGCRRMLISVARHAPRSPDPERESQHPESLAHRTDTQLGLSRTMSASAPPAIRRTGATSYAGNSTGLRASSRRTQYSIYPRRSGRQALRRTCRDLLETAIHNADDIDYATARGGGLYTSRRAPARVSLP